MVGQACQVMLCRAGQGREGQAGWARQEGDARHTGQGRAERPGRQGRAGGPIKAMQGVSPSRQCWEGLAGHGSLVQGRQSRAGKEAWAGQGRQARQAGQGRAEKVRAGKARMAEQYCIGMQGTHRWAVQ